MSPYPAPSPCVEVGCFDLAVKGGRCAQCALFQKARGGRPARPRKERPGPRARGYGRLWERRRRLHLALEPTCRICADGQLGNELDHVIPHRGARWLFDLEGNVQTLCKHHHSMKTGRERSIPIGMKWPLYFPVPERPTRLVCGPRAPGAMEGEGVVLDGYTLAEDLPVRNRLLGELLAESTTSTLTLAIPAPRTAERAFWAYVLDTEAELHIPLDTAIEGHPSGWWDEYMIDQRAEDAMEARA